MQTSREEIERLLNKTGRTLEGLQTEDEMFNDPEYSEKIDEYFKARRAVLYEWPHTFGLYQSQMIELLVGALRDALDKQTKWISVGEELPMVGQLVLTYLGGYTGDVMELCSLDEFGGWVTDMRIAEDAPITHWMPRPKPPEETNEHGRTKD